MGKKRVGKQSHRYGNVAFNALTHGVLSRQVVLPHESPEEFNELLSGLIREHRPQGATETHLVEELASILWRKRRVLLAEGAKINDSLKSVFIFHGDLLAAARPLDPNPGRGYMEVRELLGLSPDDIAERLSLAEADLRASQSALKLLRDGPVGGVLGAALGLLQEDSREWWEECCEDGEYEQNESSLAEFLENDLIPVCIRNYKELQSIPSIRAQTLGLGLDAQGLESLMRYETHLDRKFERTLGMLLKLRDLRQSGESDTAVSFDDTT
jgi:hypothetical protein